MLAGLNKTSLILEVRELILKKHLSVRQTELLCKKIKNSAKPTQVKENHDLEYLVDNLRFYLRTKVKIQGTAKRGKIEISFFSESELERLFKAIQGQNYEDKA